MSLSEKECVGSHGATRKVDGRADEFEPAFTNAIVLVDGEGVDSYRLYENRDILDRIRNAYENKKIIGAIGNAMKIVAKSNIVKDVNLARIEDAEAKRLIGLYKGNITDSSLVQSKGIITATDNSSIIEFVNKLAESLGVS